jgi:hypothetical protein
MTAHTPIPDPTPAPAQAPIPVVCDRCGAQGMSDEDPFARFGALLDFDPVPRRTARADGWTDDVQRAFIAALSLTGSPRAACRAVNKAAYGAEQLRHVAGNEGFLAAWDEALAIAADERGRRLAEGLAAVAAEQATARRAPAPYENAATRRDRGRGATVRAREEQRQEGTSVDGPDGWVHGLLVRYTIKVGQERAARLAGKVVEADYCLRQLTWLECMIDLGSGDGWQAFLDFRVGGHHPIDIAETPLSRLLGEARRAKWAELGEPDRPPHPPREYLEDHGAYATEPPEVARGGIAESVADQQKAYHARHQAAAEAQLEWEAAARRAEDPPA